MAAPTGENVVRGGMTGGLNEYDYDASDSGPVAGWSKLDDVAGDAYPSGTGGAHFEDSGVWKQV